MRKGVYLIALAGAWLVIGTSVGAAGSESPPKLEVFLWYPFVGGLTGSKSGETIAWVETREGIRNIWLAAAPDFHPRCLTAAAADDGQVLAGLNFSPDGKVLVWSRGGGEDNPWAKALPPPNPGSSVEQPHTEIWASLSGGAPLKLAEMAKTLRCRRRIGWPMGTIRKSGPSTLPGRASRPSYFMIAAK